MVNIFQTGQKLTAQDLNSAIDTVAGVQNPSNDYKWQQTSLGRMQKTWDIFNNRNSVTPSPLDVSIAVNKLNSPVTFKGKQIYCSRKLIVNVGQWHSIDAHLPYTHDYVYPLGDFNGVPFRGIIGATWQNPNGIIAGDGRFHFSLCSYAKNVPADKRSPSDWATVQKLNQDDVGRNSSPSWWWWTGITLENEIDGRSDNWAAQTGLIDIVAWPLIARVHLKGEDMRPNDIDLPFLVISTSMTYQLRDGLIATKKQELMDVIESYIGDENVCNFEVNDIWCYDEPTLVQKIAAAQFDEYWLDFELKQLANQVHFTFQMGGNDVVEQSANGEATAQVQYIDPYGIHRSYNAAGLTVVDIDGNEVEDFPKFGMTVFAMACGADGEIALSNVYMDAIDLPNPTENTEEFAHAVLSGLFNDLSAPAKRLVWVNSAGAENIMYFDKCPDFSHEIADSSVGGRIMKDEDKYYLASVQRKWWKFEDEESEDPFYTGGLSSNVWSLWRFDQLSATVDFPPLSSDIVNKVDVLLRLKDEEDGKTALLQYGTLSSLYAQLSGGGGGKLSSNIVPDSTNAAAQTSSVQWISIDNAMALQIYNFDKKSQYYDSISAALDDGIEQHIILRNATDSKVEYLALSALSASGACLSVQGNISSESAVDCKNKLLKFDKGLSSNVDISILENNPGTVDIKIGVYYV